KLVTLAGDASPSADDKDGEPEAMQNVTVEIGAPANPPGFDEGLIGALAGDERKFTIDYPANYETPELAGTRMDYVVNVKGIRKKELLPLDDEFAKEVSDVE